MDDTIERGIDQKSTASLTMGGSITINTGKDPTRHANVDAFGMVIEQSAVNLNHSPQPTGKFRVFGMEGQQSRGWDGAVVVKHGFYPQRNSFLTVFKRFIQGVTGRKTTGKVGNDNTKGARGDFLTGFYSDGAL